MLKTRVIPTLLWKDLGLVKGVRFDSWRRVGTVLPAVRVYNLRDVDELIVVDIRATEEGRLPDIESVRQFTADCSVPITVGGGITSLSDIRSLLKAGADKVSINSMLFENPRIISEGAAEFGTQCIVASIDARKINESYLCFSRAGRYPTEEGVVEAAIRAEQLGAGEILLTSIDHDGAMLGYDLELIRIVSRNVSIPVIASGGAGKPQDFVDAVIIGGASAVAAASVFHFTQLTPKEVKCEMQKNGIPVRF